MVARFGSPSNRATSNQNSERLDDDALRVAAAAPRFQHFSEQKEYPHFAGKIPKWQPVVRRVTG